MFQGSVFGPPIFSIYAYSLSNINFSHGLNAIYMLWLSNLPIKDPVFCNPSAFLTSQESYPLIISLNHIIGITNAIIFISKLTPILFHSKYSTCKKITIPFTHYFHNCTKMLFILIMFSLSELYSRGFQKLCGKYNSIAFYSSWNVCLCIWKISQFWMIKRVRHFLEC